MSESCLVPDDSPKSGDNYVKWIFRAIALCYALFQAYSYRFHIFQEDAISYLDMAVYVTHGHWQELINSCWSPLYPLFLAVAFALIKPSSLWECATVRLVNVLIFIGMLASFEFFLGRMLENHRLTSSINDGRIGLSEKNTSYL